MRIRRFIRELVRRNTQERGAVLILVAASLVGFIGMAGFAVDLGWIYLQSSNVKKAAEASALAAVAHMPLETPQGAGSTIASGLPAADAADAISLQHGYPASVTTSRRWSTSAQVRVDVSTTIDTFFLKFFGINTVDLRRHAIAEQLPPLKMGGDTEVLGTDPGINDAHFWVAANGERRQKEDGDPFSTRCVTNCSNGTPNALHRDPAYYYAVDVGPGDVGGSITVSVFDGAVNESGPNLPNDYLDSDAPGGETCGWQYISWSWQYICVPNDDPGVFTFSLIAPDLTPGDPTDNRENAGGASVCSQAYGTEDGPNVWRPVCTFSPSSQGIYVLELKVDGDDKSLNAFSLRATGGGETSVYGLGYMSLWMVDVGSSPTLQIVKLEPIYAGAQLVVSAFDLGDVFGNNASAFVTFGGSLAGLDCEVRRLDHNNSNPSSWGGDNSPGSAPCSLTTKNGGGGLAGIYNNEWVEFRFDVPPTYTCSDPNCWATVTYSFINGTPSDRTTWGARINGTPIHLLNDTTALP